MKKMLVCEKWNERNKKWIRGQENGESKRWMKWIYIPACEEMYSFSAKKKSVKKIERWMEERKN